jgi:hypothetical protein
VIQTKNVQFSVRFGEILMLRKYLLVGLVCALSLNGCTRSIEVAYQMAASRPGVTSLEKATLGVTKFEDKRSWIDKEDPKSRSFVGLQGSWRFGITFNQKDYTPVADIIQQILLEELNSAGIRAAAVDTVLSKQNSMEIVKREAGTRFDYLLGGEIIVFEYVNEVGFWSITSRRSVTISLVLVGAKSSENAIDKLFNEAEREDEGMAVLPSTNIDKLVNGVLKKVARQIVQEVSSKLKIDNKNVHIDLKFQEPVLQKIARLKKLMDR